MTKRKFSFLTLALCILLVVSLLCGCYGAPGENTGNNGKNSSGSNNNTENNNSSKEYKLTVQDPNGYIIEDLQEQYKAGEAIIVTTETLDDAVLGAYLDDVFLGLGATAYKKLDSQWQFYWEYYIIMPEHDAVLSFQIPDGLTRNGITLDEAVQTEIKTAFYNKYVDKYPDLPFDQLSLRCYGEFDGVYVIFEDRVWDVTDAVSSEVIAGVTFVYPDGLHMTVYCNNAFYKLSEAYENGILSYDNLLVTRDTYKACHGTIHTEEHGREPVEIDG